MEIREGEAQHLDPALLPAPVLFPSSCPDFPSLLKKTAFKLGLLQEVERDVCQDGRLLFISQLVGLIYHFQIIIPMVFGSAFVLPVSWPCCSEKGPDHCLPSSQTASYYHFQMDPET